MATTEASDERQAKVEILGFSLNIMSEWYVRPAMILTSFALFCGLLVNAAIELWAVLDKPIVNIQVIGSGQYLDADNLVKQLLSDTSLESKKPRLLSTDIAALQQLVVEDPWVNNAIIKRQWPGALNIAIEEQVPVAKWGDKGLLNHQGDIFWPQQKRALDFLPLLNGPSTETARVMDQYHTLSQFFKGADSAMLGLTLQSRGAWTLLLDNKIQVELGREDILDSLRRFLDLYKGHLYLKADQIEHVDVRYTNGVAVKWQLLESTETNDILKE
jgi:cell division protein FtsQ